MLSDIDNVGEGYTPRITRPRSERKFPEGKEDARPRVGYSSRDLKEAVGAGAFDDISWSGEKKGGPEES